MILTLDIVIPFVCKSQIVFVSELFEICYLMSPELLLLKAAMKKLTSEFWNRGQVIVALEASSLPEVIPPHAGPITKTKDIMSSVATASTAATYANIKTSPAASLCPHCAGGALGIHVGLAASGWGRGGVGEVVFRNCER